MTIPSCVLAMNPERYDGEVVLTEAVTYTTPHTGVMFDPLCPDLQRAQPTLVSSFDLSSELAQLDMKALTDDGSDRLIFVGTVESKRHQYGPMSLPFQINIQKLVSVYRISPTEREALGSPRRSNLRPEPDSTAPLRGQSSEAEMLGAWSTPDKVRRSQ